MKTTPKTRSPSTTSAPPASTTIPGAVKPDLADVSTNALVVGGSANAVIVESQIGARPIDMISALFMHDHVYNEFVLDSGTKSGTDWVVTMPTKRYYYTRVTGEPTVSYAVEKLFQRNFGADGACDDILLNVYDREEAVVKVDVGFSPPKPGEKANTLCWEANVMTFNASNVLGSKNNRNIATTYQNGWADLQFPVISAPRCTSCTLPNTTITSLSGARTTGTATYIGLPVVGFAAISFQNGTLVNPGTVSGLIQSQYGGNFVHKTKRTVTIVGAVTQLADFQRWIHKGGTSVPPLFYVGSPHADRGTAAPAMSLARGFARILLQCADTVL